MASFSRLWPGVGIAAERIPTLMAEPIADLRGLLLGCSGHGVALRSVREPVLLHRLDLEPHGLVDVAANPGMPRVKIRLGRLTAHVVRGQCNGNHVGVLSLGPEP